MDLSAYAPQGPVTAEAEFPEGSGSGWFITVAYLPAHEHRRRQARAAAQGFTLKAGRLEPREEAEEGLEAGLARQITAWRGLTPALVASLVPGFQAAKMAQALKKEGLDEIPCTEANRLFLLRQVHGLDNFVWRLATEAQAHRQERLEAEIKN